MTKSVFAFVPLLIASCASPDDSAPMTIDRIEVAADSTPYYVRGQLGRVTGSITDVDAAPAALADALPAIASTIGVAPANLTATRVSHDRIGMTHVRYAQSKNGLRVVGGELIVHVASDGVVRSVTSSVRDDATLADTPAITSSAAATTVLATITGEVSRSELVYVIATGDHQMHLAWEVAVAAQGHVLDLVYVDARTGDIVDRRPQVFTARQRTIFDGHGGTFPFVQDETQVGSETSPPSDAVAKAAFDNTGKTYDCYQELYQRDSYDGAGGELRSLVHVSFFTPQGATGNNAAWTGDQMVYGDGDNDLFSPLALAFDVTAHELTHGVTSATANLAYQNESGALNEGMSDIMAAVCEAWRDGAVGTNTWLIGEDVFTPATPGDALRYMADPTADSALYPPEIGGSRDFYADRFQGQEDNGGVHLNSGIPNLAFQLLVEGGQHPRQKTNVTVPAIGIDKAGAIFQRALTEGYFTETTNLAQARTATEEVAEELFPGNGPAVALAWAAVGVGPMIDDTSAPTIAIVSPADGATVAPGFAVEAQASDDQIVARVEIAIDGATIATLGAAPYTVTTSETLAPGEHTITATAFDGASNQSTASITVTLTADGNPAGGDGGGCCSTSTSPASTLWLALGTVLLVLRRRRRR